MIKQTKEGWWVIDDDSHVGKWISDSGRLDHDRAVLPAIEKYLPKGGVVVDGGALYGDHTHFYLNCVGPKGMVIAFEPMPESYRCLANNCPAAITYQLGLDHSYGHFSIRHDQNYGGAFLEWDEDGSLPVFTVPLDTLNLKRLDFLKLDVEGFEINALAGAFETIRRCKPVMLIEVNVGALQRQALIPGELYRQIERLGYRYEYLFPEHHKDMPQTDVICLPK